MKKIFLTVIVVLLAVTTVSAQYKGDWELAPKSGYTRMRVPTEPSSVSVRPDSTASPTTGV